MPDCFYRVINCKSRFILAMYLAAHGALTPALLSAQSSTNAETHVQALIQQAWTYRDTKPDSSLILARSAAHMARKLELERSLSICYNIIGIYHKNTGHTDSALYYYTESLEIRKRLDRPEDIARSHINIGNLLRKEGRFRQATDHYEHALEVLKDAGQPSDLAQAENALGLALLEMGSMQEARAHLINALELRQQHGDALALAASLNSMGNYYETAELFPEALDWYRQALEQYRSADDPSGAAKTLNNLGNVSLSLENYGLAEKFYRESLKLNEDLGFVSEQADTWSNLGATFTARGDNTMALTYFRKALHLHRGLSDRYGLANGYAHIGHLYYMDGRLQAAIDTLLLAYALADSIDATPLLLNISRDLGEAHARKGDFHSAHRYDLRAQRITDQMGQSKNEAFLSEIDAFGDLIEETKREKLETQLALEAEKNNRKTVLLYAAALGFFLLTLLFLSRRRNFRQKLRLTQAEHRAQQHQSDLELERQQKELDRRAMEQRLQEQKIQTMDALIEGQLTERQRIAQDLHDRLGAVLSVLKIHMDEMVSEMISSLKTVQAKSEEKLETVNKLIDEASDSLREISADLRAGTLDRFGLIPAIEELCDRARETGKLKVELHSGSLKSALPAEVEWSAYQVCEEALNNVLKHAEAQQVTVQLFRSGERFTVSIEDNGQGFDPSQAIHKDHQRSGMGLEGMKWRAEKAGARFSLDSQPGHGTTVMVEYLIKRDTSSPEPNQNMQ